jgi:acetyl esterase/lipase
LNYPVLDDRMTTISMSEHTDTPGWDRISTEHMWRHYLGPQADGASAYAAPARMDRLAGLPQTYIMTAEMDPLRDEGLIYAGRLLQAGVSVEVHNLAGTFHGFDSIESSQLAKQALAEQISAFQRVFRSSCPSRALGK